MKRLLGFLTLSLVASVAFAEDAYLESDGTNCLPINYYTTPNTKYVLDFAYIGTGKGDLIFGGWRGDGARVGLWVNGNDSFEANCCDAYTSRIIARDEARHTAVLDLPNRLATIYTGDAKASKTMAAASDVVDTVPVALFGMLKTNNATDSERCSTMRFYDLKVYESDELVHHYIPCIRDGLAGVYDTESGDFFTDSRYPVASGGDIMQIQDEDDDPYVSSPNGGVSVETLYKANVDSRFEIDFSVYDNSDQPTQQFLFETAGSGGANICGRVYINASKGPNYSYSNGGKFYAVGTASDNSDVLLQRGARHRLVLDAYHTNVTYYSCGLTNVSKALTYSVLTNSATQTASTRLFSDCYSSSISHYARMKLYGFKIYEKDVLMHDLVPMKSRGEGVLKDLVTGRILYSKTSTKLSYGGNIKELPYLESLTTQQCIALDYFANQKTYLEMDYQVISYQKAGVMLAAGTSTFSYRMNNNTNCEFCCHGAYSGGGASKPTLDTKRYMAIMDMPNSKVDVRSAGVSVNSKVPIDMTTKDGYTATQKTCTDKLGVFANGAGSGTGAKMRLYRLTVWEDGEIIHKYEPYVKDGVPGLKDAVTGDFFAGKDATGWTSALAVHGACPYEGAAPDAYVESDGTQAVLTDYTPKANSRIEVDFQMMVCETDKYLCGSNISGDYWDAYLASSKFRCICHSNWSTVDTIACDCNRHLLKLDAYNNRTISITDSTGATKTFTQTGSATGASIPFAVFARDNNATGTDFYGMSKVRIYSVRIYEDDTTLVHEYLPFQSGDIVGFVDTQTRNIITNAVTGANPLKIGGMGVNGSGDEFLLPVADTTIESDGSGTLTAYAPGATAYRWTLDGKVVAGETGAQLTVGWVRRPRTRQLTVTPIYDVFGNEVEGKTIEATLTNEPHGAILIFR